MDFSAANRRILYASFGMSIIVAVAFLTYVIWKYVKDDKNTKSSHGSPESSLTKILVRHHDGYERASSDNDGGPPRSYGMRAAAGGGAVERPPMIHDRLSLSEAEDGRKRSSSFPRYLYNPATAAAPPPRYAAPPHGAQRYHAPESTHDFNARVAPPPPPAAHHAHAGPSPPMGLLPLPEMVRPDSEFTKL